MEQGKAICDGFSQMPEVMVVYTYRRNGLPMVLEGIA